MDEFKNQFTSSRSVSPSGGMDENDVNCDRMCLKLKKNPSKALPTKNFMSPTVSAASKVAVPRKKVLGERNETLLDSEETHLTKPSLCSSVSDDGLRGRFTGDLSFPPYDPIRNYLSPRPKFLRYDPNRRSRILARRGNGTEGTRDGVGYEEVPSSDTEISSAEEELLETKSGGTSGSSSQQGSETGEPRDGTGAEELPSSRTEKSAAEEKDGGNSGTAGCSSQQEEGELFEQIDFGEEEDGGEDDIGEFEGGRGWGFGWVLKFLSVILAVIISTLYISSMNSPTASPALDAGWGLKNVSNKIQDDVFRALGMNYSEGMILEDKRPVFEISHEVEEKTTVERQGVQAEEVCEDEMGSIEEASDEIGHELEETTVEGVQTEEVCEDEIESIEEASEELQGPESNKIQELGNEKEFFDYQSNEADKGPDKKLQGSEDSDIQSHELGSAMEISGHETKEADEGDEVVMQEMETTEKSENEEDLRANGIEEMESFNELVEIDPIFTAAIVGFSAVLLVLTSLSFIHYTRKRNISCKSQPQAEKMQLPKPVVQEISPLIEEEKNGRAELSMNPSSVVHLQEEKNGRVELSLNPSSVVHLQEEVVSKHVSTSHAPKVELLGELVIGDVSSSLRSCNMKTSHTLLKTEESNYSFSSRRMQDVSSVKDDAVSSQIKRSNLQASMADSLSLDQVGAVSSRANTTQLESTSYGTSTAEKKVTKKEKSKHPEVNMVAASPVRRSSRIRNRTVMSP